MYNEQIENLISAALADGTLTEKEKQILFKKAQSMGIDLDEFEMVLDARIATMENERKAKEASAAPKSDKFGDIRKCPACGAILQSFQTTCPECGYEFKNVQAVQSAQKLFDQLQAVELRKSEKLSQHEINKQNRLDSLSSRHNSGSTFSKIIGGSSRIEQQEEEREDLIRELDKRIKVIEEEAISEKRNIIRAFPVPNSKEDLMELLAMATSNAYDNDGVIGPEEEVWIQKTDQIYQKIIVCAANDKAFLLQATNMIVSLMKRLPKQYKNFTQIPQEMMGKVRDDLKREKQANKEVVLKIAKKWGIILGASLAVIALLMIIIDSGFVLLSIIPIWVCISQFKKESKKSKDLF